MANAALWAKIHDQRRDLAEFLADLQPEQWDAESLCAGWRVRDVVGHLITLARTTPGSFLLAFAGSGFRFNAYAAKKVAEHAGKSTEELLAEVRETASLTGGPPGPALTPLAEVVVHGFDISHPLGIKREIPADVLATVADSYRKTQTLIGARKRIAGLHLRATDIDWQAGSGPEVRGPAGSLLLAMAGRRPALEDLSGPGVAQLTERM
jgi:uncharacterized protein (TIGR03083 family)